MKDKPVYSDESRSFEERAADLVSRMTLEEKASQLKNETAAVPRLGVSAYNYWREGLHGVARQGKATSFPSSLSMSNTWDPDLVRKAAEITAKEARGKNSKTNLSYWCPTVNMARDPRWGRNEETYGEDPYLTARLGAEYVRGMQGSDEKYIQTIATLKHFIANNVEKERRIGTSVMDEKTLREYYGRAFRDIVMSAHPASVMGSYNATTLYRCGKLLYDYIPSVANPYIMTDLLRRSWGFGGYVTGDCGAFDDLQKTRAYKAALYADDIKGGIDIDDIPQCATITKAFLSGSDTDCGSAAWAANVLDAVDKGYITEDELSICVYNLFLQRMRTGEFDSDCPYAKTTPDVLETDEHIAVSEQAAEQSWVLLKNNGILPIKNDKKNKKKIVLVGPLADEAVLGDYSGSPEHIVTPYIGITEALSELDSDIELSFPGMVTDETPLMDLSSLTLVRKDGNRHKIDLRNNIENNNISKDVTRCGRITLRDTDFFGTSYITANVNANGRIGGKIKLFYGEGGPQVCEIRIPQNANGEYRGEFTGEAGGYDKTNDLYISFEASTETFSIEKYRTLLDDADMIIAYAGTTLSDSAEFNDRADIALPESQSHAEALVRAYPEKTIAVLQTVGQVDIAPIENAAALLWTSYNGQMQGRALGRVLTGAAPVSGRLTTTWYRPEDLLKMPIGTEPKLGNDGITRYHNNYNISAHDDFPGRTYMYYKNKPVFPFGYGLSYTKFEYSSFRLSSGSVRAGESVTAHITIRNIGESKGAETVQLYAVFPGGGERRLVGFDKTDPGVGESADIKINIDTNDLKKFDEERGRMYIPSGEYKIYAAKNADDREYMCMLTVEGTASGELNIVRAMPSGLVVRGIIAEGAKLSQPTVTVDPRLSAVALDESFIDLADTEIIWRSSDECVAFEKDGVIVSGRRNGTATLYADVTYRGVTKTAKFPICCRLEIKAGEDDRAEYLQKIRECRDLLPKNMYSAENRSALLNIYDSGERRLCGAVLKKDLPRIANETINKLSAIDTDNAEKALTITIEGAAVSDGCAPEIRGAGKYKISVSRKGENIRAVLRSIPLGGNDCAELCGEYLCTQKSGTVLVRAFDTERELCGEQLVNINLGVGCAALDPLHANKLGGIMLHGLAAFDIDYSVDTDTVVSFSADDTSDPKSIFASGILLRGGGTARIKVFGDAERLCKTDTYGTGTFYLRSNGAEMTALHPIYGAKAAEHHSESTSFGGGTTVVYSADDPAFDAMFTKNEGEKLPEINGLTGYGRMREHYHGDAPSADFCGINFAPKRGWQGADGSESKSCLFFVPKGTCTVTVLFGGLGDERVQYIVQNSTVLASEVTAPEKICAVSARITDTSAPVYTYGGDKNKSVYAMIVEYDRNISDDDTVTVKSLRRGSGGYARLVYVRADNKYHIEFSDTGRIWERLDLSAIGDPEINCIAEYKNRIYAGCTGGKLAIAGDCPKCRTVIPAADFDIEEIKIEDEAVLLCGEGKTKKMNTALLGADKVSRLEAEALIARGAAVIDVREDFIFKIEKSRLPGAVNIPLGELADKLRGYDKDRCIIFCCDRGILSGEAVLRAKELGYKNAYSLET